jgi:hypothetical protein
LYFQIELRVQQIDSLDAKLNDLSADILAIGTAPSHPSRQQAFLNCAARQTAAMLEKMAAQDDLTKLKAGKYMQRSILTLKASVFLF